MTSDALRTKCDLCGREVEAVTRHHLIPRKRHKLCRKRGRYEKEQLDRTVPLCRACHDHVHMLFSERELEERYNSVESLLEREEVRKFVVWLRRQSSTAVRGSRRKR